jgi:hypothetical protein
MASDDLSFDRLVDGELDEQERRELLTRLDEEPGGWRRCALRFLESQCWKEVLGGGIGNWELAIGAAPSKNMDVDRQPGGDSSRQSPVPGPAAARITVAPWRPRPASPWVGRLGMLAAMAASFFVALWLGSWVHRGAPPVVAIGQGSPGGWRADRTVLAATEQPGPGSPQGGIDHWVSNASPAIPDDVLQALNRTGHRVQQRRGYLPVPLDDGRQVIVPVDQVELHYVGNGTY